MNQEINLHLCLSFYIELLEKYKDSNILQSFLAIIGLFLTNYALKHLKMKNLTMILEKDVYFC